MFVLSKRSLSNLEGVHPLIVKWIKAAIKESSVDFVVIEGLRTLTRQKALVAQGASKTMNSNHLTGRAVDVVPYVNGKISWDWAHYHKLAAELRRVAASMDLPIIWGGDWKSFPDGPHWELPRDFKG